MLRRLSPQVTDTSLLRLRSLRVPYDSACCLCARLCHTHTCLSHIANPVVWGAMVEDILARAVNPPVLK